MKNCGNLNMFDCNLECYVKSTLTVNGNRRVSAKNWPKILCARERKKNEKKELIRKRKPKI